MNKQYLNNHNNNQSTIIYQGSLIDSQGKEIPITEAMIQEACEALQHKAKDAFYPETKNPAHPGE